MATSKRPRSRSTSASGPKSGAPKSRAAKSSQSGGAATTARAKKKPSKKPAPKKKPSGAKKPPSRGRGTPPSRRGGGRKPSLWMNLLALLFFGATLGVVTLAAGYWYYSRDLPDVEALRAYSPPQTTRIVTRDGSLMGEVFDERRTVVPMERIPRVLVLSVLAAEDADFYQHSGMDLPGILRILLKAVIRGRATQGGSTITQQVVKNLILSPERTIERKVKELILSRRLEQELSKDEILFLYLNHINFGHGRYGVQEASQFYFGKDVQELGLAEASLIAGIPQSPARLSPRSHPEAARRRQSFVLNQLESKRELYWNDLPLSEIQQAREALPPLSKREQASESTAEAFALARSVLEKVVGKEQAARGGYTVYTSIDLKLQAAAREAVRSGLRAHDKRHGHRPRVSAPRLDKAGVKKLRDRKKKKKLVVGRVYDAVFVGADDAKGSLEMLAAGHPAIADMTDVKRYNAKKAKPSEFARYGAKTRVRVQALPDKGPAEVVPVLGPEAGAIVIDVRTREIRAIVGGYHMVPGGFSRATQALRQPGSTFKPIVYAQGIRSRKFTPATLVIDAPEVFDKWRPSNYESWAHNGPVRLRYGLAKSINMVAVRVIDTIGAKAAVKFAKDLGIGSKLQPTLALALGASEVRLSELTNAYTTFAAGGRFEPTQLVTKIVGPDGKRVPLPKDDAGRDAMTPAEAYVITSLLTSVVKEGTGGKARALGRPVAGKTGTSNQARDAWFVGFTPDTAAGVWVGYDDHRPLGRRESGGGTALPIWVEIMKKATAGKPATNFAVPPGVTMVDIDPESGLLAFEGMEKPLREVFLEGTAPTQVARPPEIADPTTFMMEQFGSP